jgi:hypothetical protein
MRSSLFNFPQVSPDLESQMVPPIDHWAWRELITGNIEVTSTKFGFNLLLTNNRNYYQKNRSKEKVDQLIEQTRAYLSQYESLYQSELRQIFREDYRVAVNS